MTEKAKKILQLLQGNRPKIEDLKDLLKLADNGLTKEEFLATIKKVLIQVLMIESKALEKIGKAIIDLKDKNNASLQALQGDLSGFKQKVEQSITSALKEQENALNFLRDKVRNLKDGKDGINGIDGRDGRDGKDGKDADEERIEKLEEEIEELKKRKWLRGGGTSAMGIANAAKYFVKTEKPVGDINSVNKTYALSKPIFAVLSMSLNGEFIARLPNYSINGKTIIFTEAIPIDYATKDWEVVYI